MATGSSDVARITGIVAAQRAIATFDDLVGGGDDPVERGTQRTVEFGVEAIARNGCAGSRGRTRAVGDERQRRVRWQCASGEPGELARLIAQHFTGQEEDDRRNIARRGLLARERGAPGKPREQRKGAVVILVELEIAGQRLAHRLGRIDLEPLGEVRSQRGQFQFGVSRPFAGRRIARHGRIIVGGEDQVEPRRGGRTRAPTFDRQHDLVAVERSADPQVIILARAGGDDRSGDGHAELAREPGDGGDLRQSEARAQPRAGFGLERRQRRVGGDQPAFAVQPARYDAGIVGRASHGEASRGRR